MSSAENPAPPTGRSGLARAAKVILVGSVMLTFISYWRTAAVVLCDLASTAFYIGGIVEQSIGKAAPWFILAVMLFSYAVRSVYIESCSLFVRGGVYRVVKEALGKFFAKLAVSALIFDYLLTGPISSVSAGQYLVGLALDTLKLTNEPFFVQLGLADPETRKTVMNWGAVVIACGITLYFFRLNVIGIRESSNKALKIMIATTIMGVIMLGWCGVTIVVRVANDQPLNSIPLAPDLRAKYEPGTNQPLINPVTGKQEDPLGFLGHTQLGERLHKPPDQIDWWSLIGLAGLFIALGHAILAMSGEETLAQVYREVESPKLPNFKRAAFIVFVFSLLFTATMAFLAVLLIPDEKRMSIYKDNLISGLAMHVIGPELLKLFLSAFVVVIGSFILSGAVNTAIIGSNGVLNRVAEDGVVPDWFRKPHPRYGTSYRILAVIVLLQLLFIIASQGDTFLLGEAYAFGVVWSFVFQALSMVVLRFRDRRPREFKVPLNLRLGGIEIPIGLILILLILLITAVMNFLTKEVATISGLTFTAIFFFTFLFSEMYHERKLRGGRHEHLERFNQETAEEVSAAGLRLTKPYRKLVAIRSTQNLFMLETALAETDPDTTEIVVMTAKVAPAGETPQQGPELDSYDQQLMTAVVQRAERAGKEVKPLIVPTNNPLYAVIRAAKDIQAQELVVGASNVYTADEQFEQIALYWINVHEGQTPPLTVRILGRNRDVQLDLGGGNRIPKISERRARSVAELRGAGVGVDRVLLVVTDEPASKDLFQAVLTMLDPNVALAMTMIAREESSSASASDLEQLARKQTEQLERELDVLALQGEPGPEIVRIAREGQYDLVVVGLPPELPSGDALPLAGWVTHVLRHAHCRTFLAAAPAIPREVAE